MKLYAITKGSYSDYHIIALTAHKEKAKKMAKLYSDEWGDAVVEEYEDGEGSDLRLFWHCDKNGCNATISDYPEKEQVYVDNKTKDVYCVYVYAKDTTHAEKKAQDMLADGGQRTQKFANEKLIRWWFYDV